MRKFQKSVFTLLLTLILTVLPAGFAAADGGAGRIYENDDVKLLIPLDYDALVDTEILQDSESGMLFSV